ncbi:hypothetical protein A2V56_00085 [Candidatus Woesebacteria bacterium RBG_19FT_COMBO_42_9]|uniref:Glycosyltransferase 2-like domain-containing protein n=1 Tax=Candidatus Woesebacteria bacterium RBG_16_42_24 TaxID=1802485 RepID=A0A1F7XKK8_9BACT|nr:MAG: hypothetical protein A2V97_02540 [Candidatus Woesebacteria bacterium RBG_16_42_24]OGM16635.1 MAG: hypothetical protein A2V56_00085 [Candidatus Woesebacteria bacterium RBG_19FT_COMBO_42_9]OGM68180.1 MAG: hypothetical protein A2985_04130 [Candidatus Woesebacteria bacterium RIFCSPLOWO2_01_FULL_43_11]
MADLTVVIVSFNTKDLTREAIDSVFKNDLGLNVDVVVVDNGSSDGSWEEVEKVRGQKLKLIRNDQNLGFAKAVNQGIRASPGKHVLLLNSDCKLKRGCLKRLFDFAETKKEAGVIGARLLDTNGKIQPSCYFFPTVLRAAKRYFGGRNEADKYLPKGETPSEVDAVVFAAGLITRRALERVGLLDERYFMYFEDLDYARRVRRSGLKVYYLPQAEAVHHHGASGKDIVDAANQWRRLIPSSKTYHGALKHHLIVWIMWLGQKWEKLLKKGV